MIWILVFFISFSAKKSDIKTTRQWTSLKRITILEKNSQVGKDKGFLFVLHISEWMRLNGVDVDPETVKDERSVNVDFASLGK